ncbi:hypothetical protein CK203_038038 [Vitis vinifera]|uniref:Uncharacterized protein n=1 Tax=Vitis vinifera TaxID=29760 RepID=A0A438HNQ0_VITVI|nr:hypothetical protein CK203_038038 [Vitis vinifera]
MAKMRGAQDPSPSARNTDRELHLREIPCLRLHRPLPFHLLRVECTSPPQRSMRQETTHYTWGKHFTPQEISYRPPAKKARVSGPGESSAPPQPQPPTTESQIPSGMTPEGIIRRPMVTQPPIEGNLDCELGHSTLSYALIERLSDTSQSSEIHSTYCRDTIWST